MSQINDNNLFSQKINVRIDDINFGNHLCHTKFINLIHNSRALFLKQHNLSESNCFGFGLVMLNLNIDYLSQCYFDDLLEIRLNIDKIEKVTFLLSYSMLNHNSGKIAAQATTLMGFLDLQKGKLKRVPTEFKDLFGQIDNNKNGSILYDDTNNREKTNYS